MYREEQLIKYRYFADLLETTGLNTVIDPLTGLISRPYILGFAKTLIADKIPFTFVMFDLDNFKFVNDTYGHSAGDDVLKDVSGALSDYLGEFGIAGRFGGDEFIFIDFRDIRYDEKKSFFNEMYNDKKVVRRNYSIEACDHFVTATVGCATFPDDADDYDDLFAMIDKTLYRGKSKGRNCYIIYVEEKHKDINISTMGGHSICKIMQSISREVESVSGKENRFRAVFPVLKEEMGITDLYYTDRNNVLHAVINKELSENVPDICNVTTDEFYSTNDVNEFRAEAPVFLSVLKKYLINTVLIVKIGRNDITDGYIVCAEPHSRRIWQEDECAIIYFFAKLLSGELGEDS